MSFFPGNDPVPGDAFACDAIEHLIIPRSSDIGGFSVRRALPSVRRRLVGPFIFFDRMGPAVLKAGEAMDVRPHPHIGLSTVTYLFDGEIKHRDSLGTELVIAPGDINLMTAGRGIVHSERTPPVPRAEGHALHGLQTWVALPRAHEETAPAFHHHAAATLPVLDMPGGRLRVVAGRGYGEEAPVRVFADTLYFARPWCVRELEAWGALFDRTKDGRILQRNFGGHKYPRLAHVGDRTGLAAEQVPDRRALAVDVPRPLDLVAGVRHPPGEVLPEVSLGQSRHGTHGRWVVAPDAPDAPGAPAHQGPGGCRPAVSLRRAS